MSDAVQVPDDIKRQFVEEVKLRGYDDKYIDRREEREILQMAIKQSISIDSARAALQQVCESQNYVLESVVISKMSDVLETFSTNDGSIDEKEFNDTVRNMKKWTNGKKTDNQCKKMIIEVIDANAYKTSRGWFSNWYAAVKQSVGV